MICQKCGYENKGGDKICFKCSAELDYHNINVGNIDTSGLELTKDEDEVETVKKSSCGLGMVMVVLGLIAVLAAAAFFMPQHLSQVRAASILEAITSVRGSVEAHVRQHRVWPDTENDLQPSIPAHLTADIEITVKKGVIRLSIPEEPGKTALISPSIKSGRVVWQCDNGGLTQDYLPIGCFK